MDYHFRNVAKSIIGITKDSISISNNEKITTTSLNLILRKIIINYGTNKYLIIIY